MHDWQTKGCSRFGASMGRASDLPLDSTGPLTLHHVPLDSGGYDPGGAYWGTPDDLYAAVDGDGRVRYLRAPTPEEARATFPDGITWTGVTGEPTESDIDDMLAAYLECALWSSTGDDEAPLDRDHDVSNVAGESRVKARKDCESFARANLTTILACFDYARVGYDWSRVGHDLWLTRNHHGAGFCDRGLEVHGDALTKAAHAMGGSDAYVGDDNKVYFS